MTLWLRAEVYHLTLVFKPFFFLFHFSLSIINYQEFLKVKRFLPCVLWSFIYSFLCGSNLTFVFSIEFTNSFQCVKNIISLLLILTFQLKRVASHEHAHDTHQFRYIINWEEISFHMKRKRACTFVILILSKLQ